MVNFCMSGCAKAAGLTALAFCLGVISGLFLPICALAVIETLLLVLFGWLCLFKW
ncbi:MAG: hypothetical protein LIO59_01705 [Oscillospiraceae bacterium]|nr:hypothetical protein [Oscillospiraceae bacterium]